MTEHRSTAMQTALIGLLGTFLTVCGGVTGALITNAATIYQLQREKDKVEVADPQGLNTLNVDTGSIIISRQEAASLDPETYYVDLDNGFVLHRPLPGWDAVEEMTVGEQLAEDQVSCAVVCDQPVFRIRYGNPILVRSDEQTTVNGQSIPEKFLEMSEMLYGPPPWELPSYSQVVLNVFPKNEVAKIKIETLPDIILLMTGTVSGRVQKVVAPQDGHFAMVQFTSTYAGIQLDGVPGSMTVDTWLLFAEAGKRFYVLEIRFSPQSGQSMQVWDDMQVYIDQFRVIE